MSAPRLTVEQAVIVTAYTGKLIAPFDAFHAAVEERLGRPVWTHEFGSEAVAAEIAEAFKADFIALAPGLRRER
jgi:hypothetical protein